MLPLITEIKIKTTKRGDNTEEHLIWAVDSIGRDWHYKTSGFYNEIRGMNLGLPSSWNTISNNYKDDYIKILKEAIKHKNKDSERRNKHEIILSNNIKTVKL